TGDLGHLDADGLLYIDGRSDDMVVSGGENVYPGEVEDLISGLDGVREVAVIGVDDKDFGARLAAYVVREPGSDGDIDSESIRKHVKTHLARFSIPRDVVFLDALPRNATGKVVARELPSP
ncbi:MAG: AMP-binding enzyme, partial [Mycobacteriaceae bacterium]